MNQGLPGKPPASNAIPSRIWFTHYFEFYRYNLRLWQIKWQPNHANRLKRKIERMRHQSLIAPVNRLIVRSLSGSQGIRFALLL